MPVYTSPGATTINQSLTKISAGQTFRIVLQGLLHITVITHTSSLAIKYAIRALLLQDPIILVEIREPLPVGLFPTIFPDLQRLSSVPVSPSPMYFSGPWCGRGALDPQRK